MIAKLRGKVDECLEESLILFVNGIGYEVFIPNPSNYQPSWTGNSLALTADEIELCIYHHIREDQSTLYGFKDANGKAVFLKLIKINGIGPKVALKIMSSVSQDQLFNMIDSGDVKALMKLPKVGKKTAEQMVLALKGELTLMEDQNLSKNKSEIQSALLHLGFNEKEVYLFVEKMEDTIGVEQGVRLGLQELSGIGN